MVAGRFVNVYSTNDWTLGVAFRAKWVTFPHVLQGLNFEKTLNHVIVNKKNAVQNALVISTISRN